jgi:hypothetical protein
MLISAAPNPRDPHGTGHHSVRPEPPSFVPSASAADFAALDKGIKAQVLANPVHKNNPGPEIERRKTEARAAVGYVDPAPLTAEQKLLQQAGVSSDPAAIKITEADAMREYPADRRALVDTQLRGMAAALNAPASVASHIASEIASLSSLRTMPEKARGEWFEKSEAEVFRFYKSDAAVKQAREVAAQALKGTGHALGAAAADTRGVMCNVNLLVALGNVARMNAALKGK